MALQSNIVKSPAQSALTNRLSGGLSLPNIFGTSASSFSQPTFGIPNAPQNNAGQRASILNTPTATPSITKTAPASSVIAKPVSSGVASTSINDPVAQARAMLAQTAAQGSTPFAGSTYASGTSTAPVGSTVAQTQPTGLNNPNFSGVTGGSQGTPVQGYVPPQESGNTMIQYTDANRNVVNFDPKLNPELDAQYRSQGYTPKGEQSNQQGGNQQNTQSQSGQSNSYSTQPINTQDTSWENLKKLALQQAESAANYQQNLTNAETAVTQYGGSLPAVTGTQEALNRQYGAKATAEAAKATALAGMVNSTKPYQQGYVLIDPQTGKPIGGNSTGSAAFQGGYTVGQETAGANYANMSYANNAAKGVKATIDDFIKSNPTINTSNLAIGNQLQQWLQGKQLGDPKVQTFLNDVQEYVNTLAPILGIGGTPTDAKTFIADSFVNKLASGSNIAQVINDIETLANNKLSYYAGSSQSGSTPSITPQTGGKTSTTGTTGNGIQYNSDGTLKSVSF